MISDTNEKTEPPPPLTQFQMNQFVMLSAMPTLAPALAPAESRLRWLEAENADLKERIDKAYEDIALDQRTNETLRAELAALKANDPLAEMWRELSEYQPQADRDGHGESWRNMCELRTVNAALDASGLTRGWSANATMWVGLSLSYRGTNAEKSAQHASEAIDSIRRAKEGA
jgi:hypothetical protein